jgi:chaperonin GroEL
MAHKRILFRSEARERVLRGATILADAVRVTLGPKSKCVLIEKSWGPPLVCNDGVTIVKEIDLEDPEENLGAHMLREAAERTADVVGDGTTTSTLLAHAIFSDGLKNLAAGASAVDIKRGLDRGLKTAVATIRGLSKPVASRKEKAQVATISAHNDAALGDFVAEAMDRVGSEGVVTVEEAKGMETSIEVVDGMQFDRGLLSPYFINDAERQQAVVEHSLMLLYEAKIASLKEFLPFLEGVVPLRRPLVVIAESVEAEALATLVVNRLRGILDCVAVKAPGYGDRRKELMQDMAILTGGRFISADLGVTLDSVKAADLGSAARIVVDRDTTTGAWSWATCGGARAATGSTPPAASIVTSSRRGSSIRRRWCGRRSKTPSAWRARSCSPRRRSRR